MNALRTYAFHIGLAFQIQDDILDIEGTSEQLGKTAVKMLQVKKVHILHFNIRRCKKQLEMHYDLAIAST